jgi:hypothetical protein
LKSICAFYLPDQYVLLTDMGLHKAGWSTPRVGLFDGILVDGARLCWAREASAVEVVNVKPIPNHQAILAKIYGEGSERATSDRLVEVLDDLFEMLGSKFYVEIDLILKALEPAKAAPEFSVGILRTTSKERRHLHGWSFLLANVESDLQARGKNAEQILIGLY